MTPLRFCCAFHLHQPVGNFDSVMAQHLQDVYRPLLDALTEGDAWPVTMHLSGPLLDWLEEHASDYLDAIARHVERNRIELLAAGHDEPILAALTREDRVEQIVRHVEHLRRRLGAEVRGLWLTERVWEPDLAEDLVQAGIRFVLVDDRHFRVSGFRTEALHAHYLTEANGHRLAVFPIDERLRHQIPFRPADEVSAYLRKLHQAGHQLAIFADDGEKFGGWPGTKKWLYEDGWMASFLGTLRELRERDEVVLSRFSDALSATPSAGLAYLPSASYREMEGWSLPAEPAATLHRLEGEWGEARLAGEEGGLLRGGHWRHFLVKYPESNRMHKYAQALSRLARERGDPPRVRRAIGRAQCNDAYWHGVFGGLYLPHLRAALWRELAVAEGTLRHAEGLAAEALDLDADGRPELWLHSSRLAALIAPSRGGMIEALLDFRHGINRCDVVARHREAYHLAPAPTDAPSSAPPTVPPVDPDRRGLLVDRFLAGGASRATFIAGTTPIVRSFAATRLMEAWEVRTDAVEVRLGLPGFRKTIRVEADGALHAEWEWEPATAADATWFSTELSISGPAEIAAEGAERWDYPVETVAKSERGFDRVTQGEAVVLLWPASTGAAALRLAPP